MVCPVLCGDHRPVAGGVELAQEGQRLDLHSAEQQRWCGQRETPLQRKPWRLRRVAGLERAADIRGVDPAGAVGEKPLARLTRSRAPM